MNHTITRRRFIEASAIAGATLGLGLNSGTAAAATGKPAILGGGPAHTGSFPGWPIYDEHEDHALLEALHSGRWGRLNGSQVAQFEKAYEQLTGAKHCLAVSCGTTALLTTLGALGIGPGDEVILPPYTFVATFNAIGFNYALPIFVDTDAESFQIDATKIDAAITKDTRLLLPVHVGGSTPDMDAILSVANKHKIPVIEDACQAHLAEWRGRVVGQSGLAGCFSFQSSKNLNSGEGGAIVTNDDEFAARCYNFHNQGHGRSVKGKGFSGERGANFRLTEFQGSLLLAQMSRLNAQSKTRDENAAYLTKLLGEIPGIKPARSPEGCTRSSHHLYMFRYQKERFADLPRAKFIEAMAKEGCDCSGGYGPLNNDAYVKALATNRHYQKIYGEATMAKWVERNACPTNDKICAEAVWFTQTTLLGSKSDMEQIAEAVGKIQAHAGEIAKG